MQAVVARDFGGIDSLTTLTHSVTPDLGRPKYEDAKIKLERRIAKLEAHVTAYEGLGVTPSKALTDELDELNDKLTAVKGNIETLDELM